METSGFRVLQIQQPVTPDLNRNQNRWILPVFVLLLFSVDAYSQKQNTDTLPYPGGSLWGSVILDYFYKAHADQEGRGNYQYSGLPAATSAFQFRRIFLGYDYLIDKNFSAELLLAAEEDRQVVPSGGGAGSSGDLLTDHKFAPYIKYANLRWKHIWTGTDLVLGTMSTPLIRVISAPAWGNRTIEKTIADLNKYPTTDLGISLQGELDPLTGKAGYDLMAGTGTNVKSGTGSAGNFYGDFWLKLFHKKLWVDLYGEYHKTKPASNAADSSRSGEVLKLTVAYCSSVITIGAEGIINHEKNGVAGIRKIPGGTDTLLQDGKASGYSLYAHGPILGDRLGFFVRYDHFNPNTYYNNQFFASYTSINGGPADPNTIRDFFTGGLDFSPVKSVHIEPNLWYFLYTGQQHGLAGNAAKDFDLVWRLTFYFSFGTKQSHP